MALTLIKDPEARNDPPRPLLEHLRALRDMIVFMAVAWALAFAVVACFSPQILEGLKRPLLPFVGKVALEGLDVTSGVTTIISIGAWGGTAVAFPFLLFALLRFVFPALTRREKVVILSILLMGTLLFVGGTVLAYAQTLPMVVKTFLAVNDWLGLPVEVLRIDGYVPLILKLILAFGLVFQIPLVLFVLGWFGLVTSATLREKRRWAIVLAFVLAMVLTPPDPMSQVIMAVPLCLMYEVAVWAVWLKERMVRAA